MRKGLEHWLNQIWYGRSPAPGWLRALAPLYRIAFLADRRLKMAQRPVTLVNKPIIVVGNITVGGSGKTPMVVRLCRILQQAGYRPGVVSRGYGRRRRGMMQVTAESDARRVGDEPLLIARRSRVPVVVAADRCSAAQWLFDHDVDVVISDDGLQHHRLPRLMEICLVDGGRTFGNGLMLPAGPLREPVSRLSSVDYVVVTGGERESPTIPYHASMHLVPGLLHSLRDGLSWRINQFSGCRVNAVAGISNPEGFFQSLQHAGLQVSRHVFPDHHAFRREDFNAMEPGLPIIMTEKDAVKCGHMKLENAWYLSVDAHLGSDFEGAVLERLRHHREAHS